MVEHVTRARVSEVLRDLGVENKFTLRTVGFDSEHRQVVVIKGWRPNPKARDVERAIHDLGVLVTFDNNSVWSADDVRRE